MKVRTRSLLTALVAAGALIAAPATLVPPLATAAPVFNDAHTEIGGYTLAGAAGPGCTVSTSGGPQSDVPVVENGPPVSVSTSLTAVYTNSGNAADTADLSATASGTARVTSANGSLRSMDFEVQASGQLTSALATSPCSRSYFAGIEFDYEFTVAQPGFLRLDLQNVGTAYGTAGIARLVPDGTVEPEFESDGQAMSFSTSTRIPLAAGTYFGAFMGDTRSFSRASSSMSGTVIVHGEFTVAGAQTSAPRGKATKYVGLPPSRSCAAGSLSPSVTTKGKRATAIKRVSFYVNDALVRRLKSPDKGVAVALPVAGHAPAQVRAVVKLRPATPGYARSPREGRRGDRGLRGLLVSRHRRVVSIAAAALLSGSVAMVGPVAQAQPVFTEADLYADSALFSQGPGQCTVSWSSSPRTDDLPVAENGGATTVGSSGTGTLTNNADGTDVVEVSTAISATGAVTSAGGNPGTIDLTANGTVAASMAKAGSACGVTASSYVNQVLSFTVSQAGFLTVATRATGYAGVEAFLEDKASGTQRVGIYGEGSTLNGAVTVHLAPGTYGGFFRTVGQVPRGLAVPPTAFRASVHASFSVAGSQTEPGSGKGKRYVDLPATRSCAAHLVEPSVTGKRKRAKRITKVRVFVNDALVTRVRTPDRGAAVSVPVADDVPAEVRVVVKLRPTGPGRPGKVVEATAAYEACA